MEMSVSVVFPEELLVAAGKDRDQFARQVMVYTLGQMYRQGQISAGFAARLLGCDRRAFYNLLSEHGFPVIDYPPDEQNDEAQTSRELARQARRR
jgi:predicted HTH domain antitoxin